MLHKLIWNKLPERVVEADSIGNFNRALDTSKGEIWRAMGKTSLGIMGRMAFSAV